MKTFGALLAMVVCLAAGFAAGFRTALVREHMCVAQAADIFATGVVAGAFVMGSFAVHPAAARLGASSPLQNQIQYPISASGATLDWFNDRRFGKDWL